MAPKKVYCTSQGCVFRSTGLTEDIFTTFTALLLDRRRSGYRDALAHMSHKINQAETDNLKEHQQERRASPPAMGYAPRYIPPQKKDRDDDRRGGSGRTLAEKFHCLPSRPSTMLVTAWDRGAPYETLCRTADIPMWERFTKQGFAIADRATPRRYTLTEEFVALLDNLSSGERDTRASAATDKFLRT